MWIKLYIIIYLVQYSVRIYDISVYTYMYQSTQCNYDSEYYIYIHMSCVCVCMCCPSNVGLHLFWETKFCYVRMWTWRDMYTYIHIWYKHSIANTGTIGNNWMEHQVNLCTIRNCDSLWFQLPANHSRGWHDIEISKIDQ